VEYKDIFIAYVDGLKGFPISPQLCLPFTLAIRIAGVGQIEHVDLELSETRCLIAQRQLEASGLIDRLICADTQEGARRVSQGREGMPEITLTERVLKDVLLLNRIGTEFYVEVKLPVSKLEKQGDKINDQLNCAEKIQSLTFTETSRKRRAKKSTNDTEPVIRFRVPKADANELVHTDRPIISHALIGQEKPNDEK